jgi:hypothetical protein
MPLRACPYISIESQIKEMETILSHNPIINWKYKTSIELMLFDIN